MALQRTDVVVLGAGIVGVSAALHLQAKGRAVTLVDRAGAAATETSFGNTGIVQSEAVFPYMFPRAPLEIATAALNLDPRVHIRYSALPCDRAVGVALFPRLFAEPASGDGDGDARAGRALASPSIARFAEPAGAGTLLREGGWLKAWRTTRGEDHAMHDVEEEKPFGLPTVKLSREQIAGARTASRRDRPRRHPLSRAADDARSAGADADLRQAVRRARRRVRRRRRAEPRAIGRRLDADDRRRAAAGVGRGCRARAVGLRPRHGLRLPLPARLQARLPHALRRERTARSSTGRCSISSAATC